MIRDYIIIFIHAWSGFDTISAIYGHGKIHLMELLLRTSFAAQTLSNTIKKRESDTTEVGNTGTQLFCFLYEVSKEDTHSTIQIVGGLILTMIV